MGAYPRAVEEREGLRERFGLRKHVAGVIATLRTFARRPVIDAAIIASGGTPSVVFGPGNIAQAHTANEFVSLRQLEQATNILVRFLREQS